MVKSPGVALLLAAEMPGLEGFSLSNRGGPIALADFLGPLILQLRLIG